jgi:phosphonopyruvate decarboxylase
MHESTGGQATVSAGVRFARVAAACGYTHAKAAASADAVAPALAPGPGPRMLHLKTVPGVPEGLPRPSVRPAAVKQRLMAHLGVSAPWSGVVR